MSSKSWLSLMFSFIIVHWLVYHWVISDSNHLQYNTMHLRIQPSIAYHLRSKPLFFFALLVRTGDPCNGLLYSVRNWVVWPLVSTKESGSCMLFKCLKYILVYLETGSCSFSNQTINTAVDHKYPPRVASEGKILEVPLLSKKWVNDVLWHPSLGGWPNPQCSCWVATNHLVCTLMGWRYDRKWQQKTRIYHNLSVNYKLKLGKLRKLRSQLEKNLFWDGCLRFWKLNERKTFLFLGSQQHCRSHPAPWPVLVSDARPLLGEHGPWTGFIPPGEKENHRLKSAIGRGSVSSQEGSQKLVIANKLATASLRGFPPMVFLPIDWGSTIPFICIFW